MSRLPDKDVFESCVFKGDTFNLHHTAVEFENYEFDTVYFEVCKRYDCASSPVLLYDSDYCFDKDKNIVASGSDGPWCRSNLTVLKLTKGCKMLLFVELPDFDLKSESTKKEWGFEFSYMAYNYNIMVDSAGSKIWKKNIISSEEKGFKNKQAFQELVGYTYNFKYK